MLALGLTYPTGERPSAIRILRETVSGWAWLDTVALDPSRPRSAGGVTFGPPRIDGVRQATWTNGTYRLEVLTGGTIRHVDVDLPNRWDVAPKPSDERAAATAPDLPSPFAADVTALTQRGLFLVASGEAIGVPSLLGPPLDATAAWSAASAAGTSDPPVVPAARVGTANGIGVVFPTESFDQSLELVRLLPGGSLAGARRAAAVLFDGDDRLPYIIVGAPDGRPWPAGIYRVDLGWRDADGLHVAALHLDLHP